MVHDIGHLMNLCVLSSNGMVQKKQTPDPSPHLFKPERNGSPPMMTLRMNTFARNDKFGNADHKVIFAATLHSTYIHSTPFLL